MRSLKKILFYALVALSTVLILITLVSLFDNFKVWYYKILDFPRLQYLLTGTLLAVLFMLLNKKWKFPSIALLIGLLTVIIIHGMVIYPYLFGEKTVPDYQKEITKTEDTFGVLVANVLIDNRQASKFLKIVNQQNPDILLSMEVNDWWGEKLQVLKESYPYHLEYPLNNAYGMSLYSKLPIEKMEIQFLKHSDVPSFHIIMKLPSGRFFSFYAVHPVAPVPSKKYPDNVGEEEVALLKIGNLVKENPLPSIVAGDFNDVSWSDTSVMFGKNANLSNVRIGRGLYNTFSSNSFFLRWPLDHYFVTEEFTLISLERLSKFGSDHYPLYAKFALTYPQ